MFFKKNQSSAPKSTPDKRQGKGKGEEIDFEEKWVVLQSGFNKLIDFLESGTKTPYDYTEYTTLYTYVEQ